MSKTQKIVSGLRDFLDKSIENPSKYRNKPTDFTRRRKLHFSNIVLFMFSLLKKVYKHHSMNSLSA